MGRLIDSRRQYQQEAIALEVYRERIHSSIGEFGDSFGDWIKAGRILDYYETSTKGSAESPLFEHYAGYIKFLTPEYIVYLTEIQSNWERDSK